jgi:hypothetical protein
VELLRVCGYSRITTAAATIMTIMSARAIAPIIKKGLLEADVGLGSS